jgi:histidyl-tRNA synthetase
VLFSVYSILTGVFYDKLTDEFCVVVAATGFSVSYGRLFLIFTNPSILRYKDSSLKHLKFKVMLS